MKKYTTLLLSAMLLIGITGSAFAEEKQAQKSFEDTVKEYNFEDNSYNVSDEQLQNTSSENILEKDAKVSFWSKVINSGHFSSNTATKTWIPVNKDVQP
jgi:septal ring-binding cell division protein DamX